jgi:Uma2 family endonuclease
MRDDAVREPVLIAKLLSHTTANDDLGAKWLAYRKITGLAHYLLAWRDGQKAELYTRKTGGWDLTIIEPPAAIDLPALAVTLSFTELYDGVDFPEARMVAMM